MARRRKGKKELDLVEGIAGLVLFGSRWEPTSLCFRIRNIHLNNAMPTTCPQALPTHLTHTIYRTNF